MIWLYFRATEANRRALHCYHFLDELNKGNKLENISLKKSTLVEKAVAGGFVRVSGTTSPNSPNHSTTVADSLNIHSSKKPDPIIQPRLLGFLLVYVNPQYRGEGIGSFLTLHSIQAGMRANCTIAKAEGVSKGGIMLLQSLGFSALKKISHQDFKDENEERIFYCKDGTDCGILFTQKLK